MFQKAKLFFLAGSLACVNVSIAQEILSENPTESLTVFGSRLDQPVTEFGSSVSVITADDIEALGVNFIIDALATVPGVTTNQNGAFGGTASVRIRGASSGQTLVIIDGVVANDTASPGGAFDFARLDVANIERIEVLKGPQSTLWGTDAIGGVVNIITKRPEEGLGGKVFAEAGSYDTYRGGAEVSGKNDRYDFRLSATGQSSDGISKADENNDNTEADGFDSTNFGAMGGVNLPGEARLESNLLWTDSDTEFDSFSSGDQGNVADGDQVSKTEEFVGNIKLSAPLFDGRLENTVLLGYWKIKREDFTDGAQGFDSNGDRKTFRYQGTLGLGDAGRMAFGAEREKNEANGDKATIDGLFGLYELQLFDSLTVTAGARYDDHEKFDSETTGRLAVAYNPNDQVTLRGSWGQGFKAPTLFQATFFCCGATEPNSNLRPESSEAFDIGVGLRTADQRGEVDLTYFNQDTDDQIDFSFAVGGYENIDKVSSKGVELAANYRLLAWLEVGLNYSYIDAKDGDGETLDRIPEHSGNISLLMNGGGRWSSTLFLTYNGEEQDGNGVVDDWTRIDISGRYSLTEMVELYVRIENLFDKEYQQILGYGTPDRSGYLGAKLRF
jgi:vitamin B12 transporter